MGYDNGEVNLYDSPYIDSRKARERYCWICKKRIYSSSTIEMSSVWFEGVEAHKICRERVTEQQINSDRVLSRNIECRLCFCKMEITEPMVTEESKDFDSDGKYNYYHHECYAYKQNNKWLERITHQ